MISVIRASDGTIKTFSERPNTYFNFALGETMELIDSTFEDYARRLIISHAGKSGETVSVKRGSGDILVDISCPGEQVLDLDINGLVDTVAIVQGKAVLTLSTEVAGVYVIQPADRKLFCPAGEGKLVIEVNL